jgi:hypothetical protein
MIIVTTTPSSVSDIFSGHRSSGCPVLSGRFRHNKGNFQVLIDSSGQAMLSATSTVIQAAQYRGLGQTGPLPVAVDGQLIEVDEKLYRITDNVIGYDPRLAEVEVNPLPFRGEGQDQMRTAS